MGSAGTPDAVTISARGVVAPTTHVSLGAIDKHPETSGIRAELQPFVRLMGKGFGQRGGDACQCGGPSNLCGIAFQVQPILVLHKAAKHRYFEPGVERLHILGFNGRAGGNFFHQVAQEFAELAKIADFRGAGRRHTETPELQEVVDPLGVIQEIGEASVAVPHFAVGEVHPGGNGAEFVDAEGMGSGNHVTR